MRIVIQRVRKAAVHINGNAHTQIDFGLLILVGVEHEDEQGDADWLAGKVSSMRIFSDHEGKMNLDIKQAGGQLLIVSQFTLHANTKKGNRPSFIRAAAPEHAETQYEHFCQKLADLSGCTTKKGVFGADMQLELINDGPVTLIMDSKVKDL